MLKWMVYKKASDLWWDVQC